MPNADWSYFEVRATLERGGRARGYLYYTDNRYDPPGSPFEAGCSTGSQLYIGWKARRAR
jgi:hypothetical protein